MSRGGSGRCDATEAAVAVYDRGHADAPLGRREERMPSRRRYRRATLFAILGTYTL